MTLVAYYVVVDLDMWLTVVCSGSLMLLAQCQFPLFLRVSSNQSPVFDNNFGLLMCLSGKT